MVSHSSRDAKVRLRKADLNAEDRYFLEVRITMEHLYIFLTILSTVYVQVVIKWQVNLAGPPPIVPEDKLWFLLRLMINPWIVSGFLAVFLGSFSWVAAMSKFNLSYAYPFTGLNFVLVILSSAIFFHESISTPKLIAVALIVAGIVIGSKG